MPCPTWRAGTEYKAMPGLPDTLKGGLRAALEATLLPRTASSSTVFAGEGGGPLGRTLGDINNTDSHRESD